MGLTKAPDPVPQSLIEKSRKKKLDKGVRSLDNPFIGYCIGAFLYFGLIPPENFVQEDPFHSKGEKALRFSWNMNPQGG